MDFDDDGTPDLVSGSYDPGTLHLFRGLGEGKFDTGKTILDKDGKPILTKPDQKQTFESFGSWVAAIDWDNDGDQDLLIGSFEGGMVVRLNEGTRSDPQFAVQNITVMVGDKPLKIPEAHATPAVSDWDGDGLWDILSGSANGGVYWLKNVGRLGSPQFDELQCLIPEHEGNGYDEKREEGQEPVPGIRSQIFAADFNSDGKVDLLLGDFSTTVTVRSDLTDSEREEMSAVEAKRKEIAQTLADSYEQMKKSFDEKYPSDQATSDEATKEWSEMYAELTQGEAYKSQQKQLDELKTALQQYFVKPAKPGQFNEFATCHGYVWLFLRK